MPKIIVFILLACIIACAGADETDKSNSSLQDTAPKIGESTSDGLPDGAVTRSLLGSALFPMKDSEAAFSKKDSLLNIARNNFLADSNNLENIVWYGRRLAYFTRYPEAISVYTRGIERHPESPELYRHRGHRYISMRQFDKAIDDFQQAAALSNHLPIQIEPDGIPNSINKPLSTLQFNIWYHLGLAHYLNGDFKTAAWAYNQCQKYSTNPDLLTATTDWHYMSLMRLGEKDEAQKLLESITEDLAVIENDGYHQRLLMYKGLRDPTSLLEFDKITEDNELNMVTQGYGVANHLLQQGKLVEAQKIYDRLLETSYWPAFGYVAAEADVARGYGGLRKI